MKYALKMLLASALLLSLGGGFIPGDAQAASLSARQIDEYVLGMMKEVNLPGVSIAVVNGDQTYVKGYGYANLKDKEAVTPDTLFELGSNSKAFTATALLLLVEQGKLSLDDPVSRYLPGFEMSYQSESYSPTIAQFLYQTSGLGADSVALMEPSGDVQALERTVRGFSQRLLQYRPGEQFLYSTGNYDVLGAVIEKATGMSYESFMDSQVMQPLGLHNSYAGQEAVAGNTQMAAGYKPGIPGNTAYEAPVYRGNTPAGYMISSGKDMVRWLNIQLGQGQPSSPELLSAVNRSHAGDETVPATETPPYTSPFRYGGGWLVFGKHQGLISHGGNNPNFSSYIMVNPAENIGIAVMGNRNSSYTYAICQGLNALIHGQKPAAAPMDTPYYANIAAVIIMSISLLLSLGFIYKIFKARQAVLLGTRIRETRSGPVLRTAAVMSVLTVITGFAVWMLPKLLFWGYPWSFIYVWAPYSLLPSMVSIFIMVALFAVYRVMLRIYPRGAAGSINF